MQVPLLFSTSLVKTIRAHYLFEIIFYIRYIWCL